MGLAHQPKIPSDDLYLCIDPSDVKSYSGGTSLRDRSGRGNNGTLVNGPSLQNRGKKRTALQFDGSNDYTTIPYFNLNSPTELSIGGWFRKMSGGANYETVLHQSTNTSIGGSAYWFGVAADDKICATIGARVSGIGWSAGLTDVVVSYNKWYHVFACWNGSTVYVYINGEQVKSYSLSTYSDPGTVTRIGASGDATGYLFSGNIGPVYLYRKYLTGDDVRLNYNSKKDKYHD